MQNLSPQHQQRLRQAVVLVITVYGIVCIRSPETFRLLDFVNLPVHETGHLVFALFGDFVAALGGTLLQLIMPLCFVISFHRRKDHFAAAIVLAWVAQNLWNVSVYIADARAQVLPLVGGGEHDWAYILGRLDLLEHDQGIAVGVRYAGVILFAFAMLRAWHWSAPAVPGGSGHAPVSGQPRT